MKKTNLYIAIYFTIAIIFATLVSSCATTHAKCDAYGQANYSQNQDTASK
jgi:hypothetical protein